MKAFSVSGRASGVGFVPSGNVANHRFCLVLDDSACEQVPAHGSVQRRYDQSGDAAGRHGIDPDDLVSGCAPNGDHVLPGHLG
jgi:hypothetical protein